MADQTSETLEGATSPNFAPYQDDVSVLRGMTVPQTIKVNDDGNMTSFGGNKGGYQGTSMTVPERIVLEGESSSERKSDLALDLQSNGVNLGTYMGGMVTPPRRLTVDDTTSRYPAGTSGDGLVESHTASGHVKKNIAGNAVNDEGRMLQESIYAGDNRSDETEDFRMQTELVRLTKRVEWLEKKISEKESNSFWKTSLVCLLTFINPLIIHWLFNRRR